MVDVTVRLVGEDKDKIFRIELDPQIRKVDLLKKIEKVTRIPFEFQQIQFRADELPNVDHPLHDIKSDEELVVHHAEIPWWNNYKDCIERVSKLRSDTIEFAKDAVRHHQRLTESKFFDVYAQFDDFQKEHHSRSAAWTDGFIGLYRRATEQYFRELHDQRRGDEESTFTFHFEEQDADLRRRPTKTLAFVQMHGEDSVSKYNIKDSFLIRSCRYEVPDVYEFYCYKLLELIGVGPKCHIIPPNISTGTEVSPYISTKWDDNFEQLEDVLDEGSLCGDVAMQLILLKLLLYITDLYEQSCGRWKGTKNAAIVDFAPKLDFKVYTDIKSELMTMFPYCYWKKEYFAVRNQHDDISWLKLAKVYLDKWDLNSKIELAREQFDPTGSILERLEIGTRVNRRGYRSAMGESAIDHLNEYIDTLRINLENLQTILNSIV